MQKIEFRENPSLQALEPGGRVMSATLSFGPVAGLAQDQEPGSPGDDPSAEVEW
jgi:hypothetical protein